MVKLSNINTQTIAHSGAIECTALVNGYFESRVYYGYSKREAKHAFKEYLNGCAQQPAINNS